MAVPRSCINVREKCADAGANAEHRLACDDAAEDAVQEGGIARWKLPFRFHLFAVLRCGRLGGPRVFRAAWTVPTRPSRPALIGRAPPFYRSAPCSDRRIPRVCSALRIDLRSRQTTERSTPTRSAISSWVNPCTAIATPVAVAGRGPFCAVVFGSWSYSWLDSGAHPPKLNP